MGQDGFMYHSVYISDSNGENEKNTYKDWHLIASTRPAIAPPTFRESYVEIPGSSVTIDMGDILAGHPTYGMREGSIEFMVLNDYYTDEYTWMDLYSELLNTVHGKQIRLRLEDDPNWYYTGRITLEQWETDQPYSTITFNYKLDPFKHDIHDIYGGLYRVKCEKGEVWYRTGKDVEYTYINKLNKDLNLIPDIHKYLLDMSNRQKEALMLLDFSKSDAIQEGSFTYKNPNLTTEDKEVTLSIDDQYQKVVLGGPSDKEMKDVSLTADITVTPDTEFDITKDCMFAMGLERPGKILGTFSKDMNLVNSKDILTYFGEEEETVEIILYSWAGIGFGNDSLKFHYTNKYFTNKNDEEPKADTDISITSVVTDPVKLKFGKPTDWSGTEEEDMISLKCIKCPDTWTKKPSEASFSIRFTISTDKKQNTYQINCRDGRVHIETLAMMAEKMDIDRDDVQVQIVTTDMGGAFEEIPIAHYHLTKDLNLFPDVEKYLSYNETNDIFCGIHMTSEILGTGHEELLFRIENKYKKEEKEFTVNGRAGSVQDYPDPITLGRPKDVEEIEDAFTLKYAARRIPGGRYPEDVNFTITFNTATGEGRL